MDKITITIITFILIIPLINAFDSESIQVCGGDESTIIFCLGNDQLSHLGKLAEAPSEGEAVGAPLSQGTNCDALSDANQRCYYLNASEGTCVLGCPPNNYCDKNYRCQEGKIITKIIKESLLETSKENKKLIIVILLGLLVVGCGVISEEEIRRRKTKKKLIAGKKEEEELKKNQKKLPKVEKVNYLHQNK